VFVASAGYELPFGAGKPWVNQPGLARVLVEGWQVNGIPTDLRSAYVPETNQLFATFNPRPGFNQSLYLPNPGPNGWFNPAAFAQPGQVSTHKACRSLNSAIWRASHGPSRKDLDFRG